MIITALSPQKRNSHRISVFIDGRYSFSLDEELVISLRLKTGDELNEARVKEIALEAERRKAMDSALNLLSYRGRSRHEIEDRLKRKGVEEQVIAETVKRLSELKLLDDVQFAEAVARDRLEFARKGKRQIYVDLRKKGIPKPIIEQALAKAGTEDEAALALVQKARPRYARLEPRERYRKLHDLLLRRGFSFDTIDRILTSESRQAETENTPE